jgi:carbamoyl-phosphate synthase large subunit
MPKNQNIKKVLVIGSGPIVIGQAAEFDYSGTQACLALREEGIEVVLVNNNPATIMTEPGIAERVYMEPLRVDVIERIIAHERPDGLLATLGGQTGLNLAVSLAEAGILERCNVTLLGTSLASIKKGEDRETFKQVMESLGEPVPESTIAENVEEAAQFANQIGYPVIVRPAYTLGGSGGGIADNEQRLRQIAQRGLDLSPISQVLIERSIKGWKEIEYEVMRDANDTCIIVCNMENIDPVGVHTGDSVVVAPSQTLTDVQYQMLRSASIKIIRELGIVGGCNIQFALDPGSNRYYIIEVNPRVSRSSALASKATGYPIARIAAKLALGYHLDELMNPITQKTYASFEPALDYVVIKIPRWPFDKFVQADRLLGTQMKATGEVMAIERNLEAALLKGVRSLEMGMMHMEMPVLKNWSDEALDEELSHPTDRRLFAVFEGLRRGYSVDKLHRLTQIDPFFLYKFKSIVTLENKLKAYKWEELPADLLKEAKVRGFSSAVLAQWYGISLADVRARLKEKGIRPGYKSVDTCAAEFEAVTPYYYSTWSGTDEVTPVEGKKKVLVLGSGPIRIGQGIEFDYASVQAALSLKEKGIEAIVVNNNPETVSTDYTQASSLYFEPLTLEDVLEIAEKEQVDGVMVQFGGQTAINLANQLKAFGLPILGTSPEAIDAAEDRKHFYDMLNRLNIPHVPGEAAKSAEEVFHIARQMGFPLVIRPSYVIGGQSMVIIHEEDELAEYLNKLTEKGIAGDGYPLLLDAFMAGLELEVDAISDGEDVLIPAIFEHLEKAGVHSGDSMAVTPPVSLNERQKAVILDYTRSICRAMQAVGMINIQMVIADDVIYVLEVNPRASRTVPILSKVTGIPMVRLAVMAQMGQSLKSQGYDSGYADEPPFYTVKAPVFSHSKLPGADLVMGPEMKSTGEVIGLGGNVEEAAAKAFLWSDRSVVLLPTAGQDEGDAVLCAIADHQKGAFIPLAKQLAGLGFRLVCTPGTTAVLRDAGIEVFDTIADQADCNAWFERQQVAGVINIPTRGGHRGTLGYLLREWAQRLGIPAFTALETLQYWISCGLPHTEAGKWAIRPIDAWFSKQEVAN